MPVCPMLLIGLGGIGAKITDRVYGMIPDNERDWVGIHANVNDISRLSHLGHGKVTQIGRNWPVRQLSQYQNPQFQKSLHL